MARTKWIKDPSAILDYKFDWAPLTNGRSGATSDWLGSGETINSHTITISPSGGLALNAASTLTDSDTSVTAWLKEGTAEVEYSVVCHIVTTDGRTDERTMRIKVEQR